MRRKPESERWGKDNFEMIGGVPWKKSEDDPEADGETMRDAVRVMDKYFQEKVKPLEPHEPVPRSMHITKDDLNEFGYTVKCPVCISILRGTTRQMHTPGAGEG